MVVNRETFQGDIFPSEQTISINWCFLVKPKVLFLIEIATLKQIFTNSTYFL